MDLTSRDVLPVVVTILVVACCGESNDRFCAFRPPPENTEDSDGSFLDMIYIAPDETVMPDNATMRCQRQEDPCFSLWGIDVPGNPKPYLVQGCWAKRSYDCMFGSECISIWGPNSLKANDEKISTQLEHLFNNTHFCCCYGDMCNVNMSTNQSLAKELPFNHYEMDDDDLVPLNTNYKRLTIIIALSSVTIVAIVIMLSYLVYRKLCLREEVKLPDVPDNSDMYLVKSPSTPDFDLDQLKLESVINKGRYGEVWKGTLNDMEVAIKVFTASQKNYFINERDIYLQPHMDHEALLTFYGAEERLTVEGNIQYVLVMSYVPQGTLTCYLKNNTLDWSILCKMGHSITSGLAYLHSEISTGDQSKLAIAHRDLNSRNVLVNWDLSCCICDFGFAMKSKRCNMLRNGAEENVEQAALTDVGTLLYMAPEVLEGAVNLRDCESSLKQIDVYALGLVLWELASRCSDLYQGMPVPEYKLPYQSEIGLRPTFEEMQLLVTKNKARPAFPDVWKDTNQPIRALKETIEDCWDQDGEARLTALCVEERILDMMTMWDHRHHRGITPTVISSGLVTLDDKLDIQHNITHSSQEPSDGPTPHCHHGNLNLAADLSQMSEPVNELSEAASRRAQRISYTDTSMSAASTIETTLSPSELDDPVVPGKADCNVIYAQNKSVLQPHQGQNPTVERNTHRRSDEDVTVFGNTLVKGPHQAAITSSSAAASPAVTSQSMRNRIPNASAALQDELLGAFSDNLESSLVQNDLLNQTPRHATPRHQATAQPGISFTQNHSTTEPPIVRPKQPNVPGNGTHGNPNRHYTTAPSNLSHPNNTQQKPSNWFGKFRKSRADKKELNAENPNLQSSLPDKDKDSGKLNFPFFGKRSSNSSSSLSSSNSSSSRASLTTAHLPTEVRILNGAAVVRPTSLPIHSSGSSASNSWQPDDHSNVISGVPNGTVHDLEHGHQAAPPRGDSKLNTDSTHPDNVKSRARSAVDLSPQGGVTDKHCSSHIQLSDLESNGRVRRPQSLSTSSSCGSAAASSGGNLASPTFL